MSRPSYFNANAGNQLATGLLDTLCMIMIPKTKAPLTSTLTFQTALVPRNIVVSPHWS